jgi:hypothetical protein
MGRFHRYSWGNALLIASQRLCLQKMLITRPERRSETRSNVIEEVRNLHWQEIDP